MMTAEIALKVKQNINRFYWFKTVSAMSFFLPIIVLYWQNNGLSMTQIMLLQSVFAILVVALEIPTGYVADMWGRRKTLILSSAAIMIAYAVYALSGMFWQFLVGEIMFAIGISLLSGSDAALLYDTLQEDNREEEYKKIWGKALFYMMVGIAFSNIIGGFLGQINYILPLWLSVIAMCILILIAFSLREPTRHKLIVKKGHVQELLRILRVTLLDDNKLKWFIWYIAVIFSFYQSALWFYQPYFSLIGLDIVHFGLVFASFQVVAAFSSKYAHLIEKKLGMRNSFILLFVLVFSGFFLMGSFVYWFSFTFAFMQQFIRGFSKVIVSDYINKHIDSSRRATVLSIQNMANSLFYALFIPFAGYVADVLSLLQAFFFIGTMSLVVGGFFLIIVIKKKVV